MYHLDVLGIVQGCLNVRLSRLKGRNHSGDLLKSSHSHYRLRGYYKYGDRGCCTFLEDVRLLRH